MYVQVTGILGESSGAGNAVETDATWVVSQLVGALTSLVDEAGVAQEPELLDMTQTQHYRHLQLGVLLGCDSKLTVPALSMALRAALGNAGLQVSVSPVSPAVVTASQVAARSHDYVLTVLSAGLSPQLLQSVSGLLSAQDLHVTQSRRLTIMPERLALHESDTPSPSVPASCVFEFHIQGSDQGLTQLQRELVPAAQSMGVDLVLQRDDAQRRLKRLAVFDMDSTLIQAEVIDALARRAGVGDQVSAITERAMQGEIDFRESFKSRMALLEGLSEDHLADIAQELPIMPGAVRLFKTLKAYGIKTAIISGGFTYFAQYLQTHLGVDYVFANTLSIEAGKVTGDVVEPIVDAARKAEIVKSLAQELDIDLAQVVAVGDGANDLLMLKAVGAGIAFRAKPLVRQSSKLALTTAGLDGVLFLMGLDERDHH
jgi:phosphoserine phosphatase